MIELLSYTFMQNALAISVFSVLICAVAGTIAVVNRTVYITGGVAHASYGGIGLALFAGISPTLGAMAVAVVMGIILGLIKERNSEKTDAVVSGLWAAGMAAGIILSDLTPGYSVDFLSYLFGNILLLSHYDIILAAVFAGVLLCVAVKFYRTILVCSADQEYAVTLGINVRRVNILLLVLLCASVIVLMRVAGLILVMAILSIPASIAETYSKRLSKMMVISGIIAAVAIFGGLTASVYLNLTPSAVIVAVLAVMYLLNILTGRKAK